jgi:ribosomal protein S18 acetylase RimI-like enzyme
MNLVRGILDFLPRPIFTVNIAPYLFLPYIIIAFQSKGKDEYRCVSLYWDTAVDGRIPIKRNKVLSRSAGDMCYAYPLRISKEPEINFSEIGMFRSTIYCIMTAVLFANSPIRKVNVRKDLPAIADLIEVCFSDTLDEDGRMYLNHLRWAARDFNYLSWLQGAAERIASPLYGFVWEENGRIVGNLSLISLYRQGKPYFLIANVAVHPDSRRRGIARQLTQAAIDHLVERGVNKAWLQVRDDNPSAFRLYQSLGFIERARRTNWITNGSAPHPDLEPPSGVSVRSRRSQDWHLQTAWLQQCYPPEVSWNLPINLPKLSPNPLQYVLRWLSGDSLRHWAVYRNEQPDEQPVGFLTWEPMRAASDVLWLAAGDQYEDQAVPALLLNARQSLAGRRRSLSVNYPYGRAAQAFAHSGFINQYTLVWMSISL